MCTPFSGCIISEPGSRKCKLNSMMAFLHRTYSKRLMTFEEWPLGLAVRPEELAKSGFFYPGRADVTKCFACNVQLKNWLDGDNVEDIHKKYSPECPFLHMKECM